MGNTESDILGYEWGEQVFQWLDVPRFLEEANTQEKNQGVLTSLGLSQEFIKQWNSDIGSWKEEIRNGKPLDEVIRLGIEYIENQTPPFSEETRAYLLMTLTYITIKQGDGGTIHHVLLRESERRLDNVLSEESEGSQLEYRAKFAKFAVLLEKARVCQEYAPDHSQLEQIVDELGKLKKDLKTIPSYFLESYAFLVFSLGHELKKEKLRNKEEEILPEIKESIPHHRKIELIINMALSFLPKENIHVLMGEIVSAYNQEEVAPEHFLRFFQSLGNPEGEQKWAQYKIDAQKEFTMRAQREWLKSHPDKTSEGYIQGKMSFFKEAGSETWNIKGKKWIADILATEGLDIGDQESTRVAAQMYEELGMVFREAEIRIKQALRFEKDKTARKDILFRYWGIIEKMLGRSVVEVFLQNLSLPEERVYEVSSEALDVIHIPKSMRNFKRTEGIPDYINDIAELIVSIYGGKGKDYLQALKKALEEYYLQYLSSKGFRLRDAAATLGEVKNVGNGQSPELFEKIKEIFGFETVEVLQAEDLDRNVSKQAAAEKSLQRGEVLVENYILDQTSDSPQFLKNRICIPVSEEGVVYVLQNSKEDLLPEEINLLQSVFRGEDQSLFGEGEVKRLLTPKKIQAESFTSDALPRKYLDKIKEFYLLELGIPPIPDAEHWVVLTSEKGDFLGSVAFSKTHLGTVPLIFQRFPNNLEVCEEAFKNAGPGAKMEECLQTGTFSAHPLFRDKVLPNIFYRGAIKAQELGFNKHCASVHRAVRLMLRRFLGSENIHSISVPEDQKISAEEMKKRLKIELAWGDELVELWGGHVKELQVETVWFSTDVALERTTKMVNI